jgi:uncharacterized protein with NRDE domain
MCVIFIAFDQHPQFPLVLLANRDEFYDRPTAAAARWEDIPCIFAGRDLIAGGTWLGVTDGGRLAAVTNYREPGAPRGERSRGDLVAGFLRSNESSETYLASIGREADQFSGFNLIVGEINRQRRELFYYSNRGEGRRKLGAGIYGLSNHLLNTAWPKVSSGLARFQHLLNDEVFSTAKCFELLRDETIAADADLPDTGVGVEHERLLSPIFIRTPVYGTRSSTVVLFDNAMRWTFDEKVFI